VDDLVFAGLVEEVRIYYCPQCGQPYWLVPESSPALS
jgi:hypothetical protein